MSKPDQKIYESIMGDIGLYTGQPNCHSPRFEKYPYPQRLGKLNDLLKGHTLRECGNYKKYLELQREIFDLEPSHIRLQDQILYSIIEWLDREVDAMADESTDESDILVISLLVFGEDFIERMLEYNFKSLMSFENLPSIASDKRIIIYIQTDLASRDIIEGSEIVSRMKAAGIFFDYAIIPDGVINVLDEQTTYWLLGACASLSVSYAKSLKADFHHSYPDAIYSERFFSELLRLSRDNNAILGQATRADETLLKPKLEPYITDELKIPSGDLMAHHMNCIHSVAWPLIVNNRPRDWSYPVFHVMIWESEEYVHLNCPHLNAYWLSYETLKDLETRFYMTFDSELDLVCKGEDYYIPQGEDDLYMADLSAPSRGTMIDVYSSAQECAYKIWGSILFRDTLKFFFRGMRVKVNRDIRPTPTNYIPEAKIRAEKHHLYNTIMESDPYTKMELKRERTHAGYVFT